MRAIAIRGASALWSTASAVARAAAQRGWLESRKLDTRVVSVGNLQAGGAGKTPLVAQIAREAAERGLMAWVLTRGYGGAWERSGGVLLPGAPAPAADCGDEAALLHELAPQATIGVGADRARQYDLMREQLGRAPDLVVLDDGLQHWRIRKDVEIVAVTSRGPAEVPYRDGAEVLARADLVVWTKGDERPAGTQARVRYRLKAPLQAGPRWLISGVADGADVERLARESGYDIARHVRFGDHARYNLDMIKGLLSEATKAQARIAVTGKDWVKWREHAPADRVDVLEPELEWLEGREQWTRLLWGH